MQVRWPILAAIAVLAAPVAAQQQASFSLEQKDLPSQVELRGGESVDLGSTLNLTGEGFSCSAEVEAPVNVTVEASLPDDAPPNASLTPTDTSKAFPIPAGEYTTNPYSQEANVTVSASAGSGLTENVTGTLSIAANYPGGNYSECVPMQFSSAEAGPAEVQVDLVADDPPEPEPEPEEDNQTEENNSTPPANQTPETNSEDEGNGIPAPTALVPPAMLAAALLVARRREA